MIRSFILFVLNANLSQTKNNRSEPLWPVGELERAGKLQRAFPGEERLITCPCSESSSSAQALEPKAVTAHYHPQNISYLPWGTKKDKLGVKSSFSKLKPGALWCHWNKICWGWTPESLAQGRWMLVGAFQLPRADFALDADTEGSKGNPWEQQGTNSSFSSFP